MRNGGSLLWVLAGVVLATAIIEGSAFGGVLSGSLSGSGKSYLIGTGPTSVDSQYQPGTASQTASSGAQWSQLAPAAAPPTSSVDSLGSQPPLLSALILLPLAMAAAAGILVYRMGVSGRKPSDEGPPGD
jgi:hypothetical protein